jgi:opacity protein-like surface antigen
MFWKRIIMGLSLACGWAVLPMHAQNRQQEAWKYKVELLGDVAHGWFYHGDHILGDGLDYGGGVGIRPFSGRLNGLGFEARTSHLSDSGSSPAISSSLDSRLIAINALYHFRSGKNVQPFVLAGIGHVKKEDSYSCTECVYMPDPVTGELVSIPQYYHSKESKTGIVLGGGMKIALHRHLSIRPEIILADTTPGSGPNWTWFRCQIGVGVHF